MFCPSESALAPPAEGFIPRAGDRHWILSWNQTALQVTAPSFLPHNKWSKQVLRFSYGSIPKFIQIMAPACLALWCFLCLSNTTRRIPAVLPPGNLSFTLPGASLAQPFQNPHVLESGSTATPNINMVLFNLDLHETRGLHDINPAPLLTWISL